MKYITDPKTAHRIKRKRCNPQKSGYTIFATFYCLISTGLSVRALCSSISQPLFHGRYHLFFSDLYLYALIKAMAMAASIRAANR